MTPSLQARADKTNSNWELSCTKQNPALVFCTKNIRRVFLCRHPSPSEYPHSDVDNSCLSSMGTKAGACYLAMVGSQALSGWWVCVCVGTFFKPFKGSLEWASAEPDVSPWWLRRDSSWRVCFLDKARWSLGLAGCISMLRGMADTIGGLSSVAAVR